MQRSVLPLIFIYAALSLITNFPSGFTNSTVNTAVEELQAFINSSYTNRGNTLEHGTVLLIQSGTLNCWFVGQVFGAIFTPYITDKFGRKVGYLTAVIMTIVATAVQYLAIILEMPEMLIVGRTITAISSPLCDASLLLYLQETSPLAIRGMASFFCEIGYGAMCVLGSILGMRSVLGSSLDQLLLVSIFPEIVSLIFLFFIPETPKFLMIIRGDRSAAMKSLEFFQGEKKENEQILDEYERERMQDDHTEKSSFKEVLSTWHLRQAVFLSCAVLVLTLSFYPILQSSTYFFLRSGIPRQYADISSTVLLIVFTISSVIGASFIDHYPRRFLIIFFGFMTNMFLLAFAVFSLTSHLADWTKYACVGSMVAYCVSFGMVLGPISWFVAPEMVSQRHKSTVFATCFAINNIFIALTDFATIPLFRVIGGSAFILLFVVPSLFCLPYLFLYLPETLAKETHEIVAEMLQKRNKSCLSRETSSQKIRGYSVFSTSASANTLANTLQ